MQRIKNLNEGVKYMLLASLCFAFMGAFAKLASQNLPSLEIVFFRNIAGVILIASAIAKKPLQQKGGKPFLLLFRGMMGFSALLAFFYLIAHIPLGDAMTWSKTSPIFTAIFAWFFLKEKMTPKAWGAVFLGFIGILFITKPTGLTLSKYDLLGLFSGIGAALAYTSIRELRAYYETRAIVLSFVGVGTIGPIILFLIAPYINAPELDFIFAKFVLPKGIEWFYLIAMGIIATISQLLMTKAYGATKAGIVGAVSYTNILFSILVGTLLGDDLPDMITTTGIVLIVVAGIMVAKEK
ncbi:MAG: DMT family transporter [Epsilonproteobacteria bacterium]|nr:DMT family transporter [Campylobacterota bacterium]